MAQTMPFRIGADAGCTDGAYGQVSRIIVDPATREVTHLAVDPKHRRGPGRLVPVDLGDATTGQIRLRCTLAEFRALRPAKETEAVLEEIGDPPPHVILMTAYAQEGRLRAAIAANAFAVVSKPFETRRMIGLVAEASQAVKELSQAAE